MKRFKLGDKVVALTNPEDECCQPRTKGQIYTVEDIMYCSRCGIQSINIGAAIDSNDFEFDDEVECQCGNIQNIKNSLYYTDSDLFAKVNDIEEELEIAISNEDYELAAILRDIKKESLV